MEDYMRRRLETIRNLGIMAHVDAGKTTLSEQLLLRAGRIRRAGNIDDGDTVLDFTDEERERGITIDSAATSFDWERGVAHRVNLVDTPGHVDFTLEVERALRVLDGAVAVFCAVGGVEPQSETVWRQADRWELPRIAFVNKMDLPGADFEAVVEQVRDRLGARTFVVQRPWFVRDQLVGVVDLVAAEGVRWSDDGMVRAPMDAEFDSARVALVEQIVAEDDRLMGAYLDGVEPTATELRDVLRRLVVRGAAVPVLCGTALGGIGVELVLDAVVDYLPSPKDRPDVRGVRPGSEDAELRRADDDAPFSALVFKLVQNRYSGQLAFVRVYSGVVRPGDVVLDSSRGITTRVGRIVEVSAGAWEDLDELRAGSIGAVLGVQGTRAGSTLCDSSHPVELAPIPDLEPVVWMSLEPGRAADRVALADALHQLVLEDPGLRYRFDEETGESLIGGQGELQLEVAQTRLRRRYKVDARFGEPVVAYRETVESAVEHEVRLKKQSGGPGMYARIRVRVEPAERGEGVSFVDEVAQGAIPKDFVAAVEQGVRDAASAGGEYPLDDLRVTLLDGDTHPVDSSALAFSIAGRQALLEAAAVAGLRRLEPMMRVTATAANEAVGATISELERRRGRIVELEPGDETTIVARAPLADLFGFSNALRSATSGRARYHFAFDGFA